MLINYKNVNIYQQQENKVLENVCFQVDEGEFVYIIGRVGSGKSSLLKTLYCDLDVDEAEEANVLGYDLLTIRRKEIPALRKQLGVVFQVDRYLAIFQTFNLLLIDIDTSHISTCVSETGSRHQTYISSSYNCYIHKLLTFN